MSKKPGNKSGRVGKSLALWTACTAWLTGPWGRRIGRTLLVALTVTALGVGVGGGFRYLDRYVHRIHRQRPLQLRVEIKNPPHWASQALVTRLCHSTGIVQEDFILDDSLTARWAENLRRNPWVKEVRLLRKRYDGVLEIDCQLRQPIASLRDAAGLHYVDVEGTVLPAFPLAGPAAHLVRLQGEKLSRLEDGKPLASPALLAGLAVLAELRAIDEQMPYDQRLWDEIAVMDVGNYDGRLSPAESHLVLYTANNTEIRWGVAYGKALAYLEAPEPDKFRRLYQSFARFRSLGAYEYVDLRNRRADRSDPLRQNG